MRLIQAEGDLKKRGSIELVVLNQGSHPFNFGPENVTAMLADRTPVAIITYDQLMHEEKRRETWRGVFAALATMISGQYTENVDYSGSSFGTVGTSSYQGFTSGTATGSGYDPVAAAVENRQIFDRVAERNAAGRHALQQNIRTTTVDPQQVFGGAVTFELPEQARNAKQDVPMTFVVTVDGEEHRFDAIPKRR